MLAEGGVEKIGLHDAFIKFKIADGSKKNVSLNITNHNEAIKAILDILTSAEYGCIKSFDEIDAVGHRVVHGGEKFNKSVLINDEVIEKIKQCYAIAPTSQPGEHGRHRRNHKHIAQCSASGCFRHGFPTKLCRPNPICTHCPTNITSKTECAATASHGTSHRYVSRPRMRFSWC